MWDGERMRLFPNDWGGETPLSGNLIEEIAVTTDSLFWIRTNYGLDLFDPDSKRVERHADFQGMYKIVTRRGDEVLVVTQDNKFSCYDPAARRFSSVQPMPGIDYADILDMRLDDDGALWVFSRKASSARMVSGSDSCCNFSFPSRMMCKNCTIPFTTRSEMPSSSGAFSMTFQRGSFSFRFLCVSASWLVDCITYSRGLGTGCMLAAA